jgi:hypothetical protein
MLTRLTLASVGYLLPHLLGILPTGREPPTHLPAGGLGNVTLLHEDTRAAWGWTRLDQLGQDLRYAFRTMASNRLFTSLAVLSLALGIGANTAIYSFMDWILMRSLPVHDPKSLVVMNWRAKQPRRLGDGKVWHSMSGSMYGDDQGGLTAGIFPYPVFDLFYTSDSLFSSVFAFSPAGNLNLTTKDHSDLARHADQPVAGNRPSVPAWTEVSRAELLLAPDHGAPASRRHTDASAGGPCDALSPMGGRHCDQ